MVLLMPLVGLAIGALASGFAAATDHHVSDVLFSGQDDLGSLIDGAATWSVGALVALMVCKGLAYALSLSSFRGGPVFPAIFIGAAGGIAAAGLPGLELVPAVAMGIGAMSTVMLSLPLTSTLLASLLLGDGCGGGHAAGHRGGGDRLRRERAPHAGDADGDGVPAPGSAPGPAPAGQPAAATPG